MASARSATTITIPLTKSLREFLELQVQAGLGKSMSDYVVRLLKQRQREDMKVLEAKLLASLDSGPGIPMDAKFWAEIHERIRNPPKRPGRS